MNNKLKRAIEDAFTSMLRSDYIPLKDTDKLIRLAEYYVDYLGFLRDVVGESDHLIVGRRGTGKTTLLYRGLIECINSWTGKDDIAKTKTLGIYIDLSKCQSLEDTTSKGFSEFEHVFASELYESIKSELLRTWPALSKKQGLLTKIFSSREIVAQNETNEALNDLSKILIGGVLRTNNRSGTRKAVSSSEKQNSYQENLSLNAKVNPEASASTQRLNELRSSQLLESTSNISYRLNISDILRSLNQIREAAQISHIVIFVDEFSSLNSDLQRRFSTLLRKILGNHSGVFVKLCAITDNYTLGSSIILQRDLFELNLDLDSYVERSGSLGSAMKGLDRLTKKRNGVKRNGVKSTVDPCSKLIRAKWGQERNGVKSTVDPCSKLIRVKSRLDPSDLVTLNFMETRWNISLGENQDKIKFLNLSFVLQKET